MAYLVFSPEYPDFLEDDKEIGGKHFLSTCVQNGKMNYGGIVEIPCGTYRMKEISAPQISPPHSQGSWFALQADEIPSLPREILQKIEDLAEKPIDQVNLETDVIIGATCSHLKNYGTGCRIINRGVNYWMINALDKVFSKLRCKTLQKIVLYLI